MTDDELSKFLDEHGGLEGFARKLGQYDPFAAQWEPAANDNEPNCPVGFWAQFSRMFVEGSS